MKDLTKNRIRKFQGLAAILVIIFGLSAYYTYQSSTSSQELTGHKNNGPQYSFEKPGQLLSPDPDQSAKSSKYKGLSADQLNQAASDLIKRADAIVLANPIEPEPITAEQQAVIDKKTRELEGKIKALEKNLAN